MADSGHKNLGPASQPNEYLKTRKEGKQSEKWKGRGRKGRGAEGETTKTTAAATKKKSQFP